MFGRLAFVRFVLLGFPTKPTIIIINDDDTYRIAGNIGGHYIWRKSHKLGLNNIGEILIWRLSVAVHIGKHAL